MSLTSLLPSLPNTQAPKKQARLKPAATKTTGKKKKRPKPKVYYPSGSLLPRVRNYLAQWPTGEVRSLAEMRRAISYDNINHLEFLRYLEGVNAHGRRTSMAYTWSAEFEQGTQLLRRTDRPCPAYRGAVRRGLYPWSADEHWQLLQESPLRAAHAVQRRLTGASRSSLEMRMGLPVYVRSQAMLERVRDMLVLLLEGTDPTWTTAKQRTLRSLYERGVLAPELVSLLSTGMGLRQLLLELCVEPEFDDAGKLRHFSARVPEDASEELETLLAGDGVLGRYHEFMRRWRNDYVSPASPRPERAAVTATTTITSRTPR